MQTDDPFDVLASLRALVGGGEPPLPFEQPGAALPPQAAPVAGIPATGGFGVMPVADIAAELERTRRLKREQDAAHAAANLTTAPPTIEPAEIATRLTAAGHPTTPALVAGSLDEARATLANDAVRKALVGAPATAGWVATGDNAMYSRQDLDAMAQTEKSFLRLVGDAVIAPFMSAGQAIPATVGSSLVGLSLGGEALDRMSVRNWTARFDAELEELALNDTPQARARIAARMDFLALGSTGGFPEVAEALRSGADIATLRTKMGETDLIEEIVPAPERPLYKVGEYVGSLLQDTLAPPTGTEDYWATQLGGGLGSMVAYMATSAVTGFGGLAIMATGAGVDEAYDRAKSTGMTHDEAIGYALGGSAPGFIQALSVEYIMRKLPGGARRRVSAVLKDLATSAGAEAVVETLGVMGQNANQMRYDPTTGLMDDTLPAALLGGSVGAIARGMVLALAPGARRTLFHDIARREQSGEIEQTFAALADGLGGSELRAKVPEKFRAWATAMTTGTKAETVFVSPEGVTALAQAAQSPQMIDQIVKALPGVTIESFNDALANGTDLAIPMSTWLTDVIGTDADRLLLPHIRLDPTQMTTFERKASATQITAEIEALQANIESIRAGGTVESLTPEERDRITVFDAARTGLATAGVEPGMADSYAAQYAAFYARTSARAGMNIEEFMQRFPLANVNVDGTDGMAGGPPVVGAPGTMPMREALSALRRGDMTDPLTGATSRALADLGLDPATMTDEEIFKALDVGDLLGQMADDAAPGSAALGRPADARVVAEQGFTTLTGPINGVGPSARAITVGDEVLAPYDANGRLPDLEKASPGPVAGVRELATRYMRARGLPVRHQSSYVKVDVTRAQRIAQLYENGFSEPKDPQVRDAYAALAEETLAQYEAILELGYTFEWIVGDSPYATPADAVRDMQDNKHLWVFPTTDGFGQTEELDPNNMLLAPTEYTVDGRVALVNDIFRIVHDVFGHGSEGASFGPRGEENAWQAHVRMFSPLAARAMTSETRGQNSWVNFGPFGEANRADPANTTFAVQKALLLPEWVSTVGQGEDVRTTVTPRTAIRAWFGNSKAVDAEGNPEVFYHGTDTTFDTFDMDFSPGEQLGFHFGTEAQGREAAFHKGGPLMAVHVKAENPLRLKDFGTWGSDEVAYQLFDQGVITRTQMEKIRRDGERNKTGAEAAMVDAIKAAGYDSVIYLNRQEGIGNEDAQAMLKKHTTDQTRLLTQSTDADYKAEAPSARDSYIVFAPTQVKSVDNEGSFNPDRPSIFEQPPIEYRGPDRGVAYVNRPDRPQLPVAPDGTVLLTHWSGKPRKSLKPSKAGSGPLTSEQRRQGGHHVFYGIAVREKSTDPGTGYAKEGGLGPFRHETRVPADTLYPYFEDPDGLFDDSPRWPGALNMMRTWYHKDQDFVRAIRKAGYLGYYVTVDESQPRGFDNRAPLGNVAVVFKALRPEAIYDDASKKLVYQRDPDGEEGGLTLFQSEASDWYYSALTRAAQTAKPARASAKDWEIILGRMPGVRRAEIDWTGVMDWLGTKTGSVSRDELVAYLQGQELQIDTVIGTEGGEDGGDIKDFIVSEEAQEPDADLVQERAEELVPDHIGQLVRLRRTTRAFESHGEAFAVEFPESSMRDHIGDAAIARHGDYDPDNDEAQWLVDNASDELDDVIEGAREQAEAAAFEDHEGETASDVHIRLERGNFTSYYDVTKDSSGDYYYDGGEYGSYSDLIEALSEEFNAEHGYGSGDGEDPGVKFEQYKEGGRHEDYQERTLSIPRLHSIGPNADHEYARGFVFDSHFTHSENIVVHARTTVRTGPHTPTGRTQGLFVEEIQSDLNNETRKKINEERTQASRSLSRTVTFADDGTPTTYGDALRSLLLVTTGDDARGKAFDRAASEAGASLVVGGLPPKSEAAKWLLSRADPASDPAAATLLRKVGAWATFNPRKQPSRDKVQADELRKTRDDAQAAHIAAADVNVEARRNWRALTGDDQSGRTVRDTAHAGLDITQLPAMLPEGSQQRIDMQAVVDRAVGSPEMTAVVIAGAEAERQAQAFLDAQIAYEDTRPLVLGGLPASPFDDVTAYEVMLKNLLAETARNPEMGFFAWTPGYMQAERWSGAIQAVVGGVQWLRDGDPRATAAEGQGELFEGIPPPRETIFVTLLGTVGSPGDNMLRVDADSGLVLSVIRGRIPEEGVVGVPLSSLIGTTLAARVTSEDSGDATADNIIIGGDGYRISYDQTIKGFIEKFVKRYGGKVEQRGDLLAFQRDGAVHGKDATLRRMTLEEVVDVLRMLGSRQVYIDAQRKIARDRVLGERALRVLRAREVGGENPTPEARNRIDAAMADFDRVTEASRTGSPHPLLDPEEKSQLIPAALQLLQQGDPAKLEPVYAKYPDLRPPAGRKVWYVEMTPELRAAAAQPQPLFQKDRGRIVLPPQGRAPTITLFAGADPSTLLHEMGHQYLYILQALAADTGQAASGRDPKLAADWATINEWWAANADEAAKDASKTGTVVTGDDVRAYLANPDSLMPEQARAIAVGLQEQWARAFESYLMSGRSPTIALRNAFQKFKVWLLGVYSRASALNVNISPEMREVFDRLLAADEEIVAAKEANRVGTLTAKTATEMGVDEATWQRLLALQDEAVAEQEEHMLREIMAPMRRQAEAAYREELATLTETVRGELAVEPVHRLREWMGNGRWLYGDVPEGMLEGLRLDRAALVEQFGEEVLRLLPRGKTPLYSRKGEQGAPLEEVADLFGFTSADAMVTALKGSAAIDTAAAAEAKARLKAATPDPLLNDSIEQTALDALHGEKAGQLLVAELRALAKSGNVKGKVTPRQQAREVARRTIGGMKAREATRSHVWQAAERAAADAAAEALARGDRQAAFDAKRKQLVNHMMYSESRKAAEAVGQIERRAARLKSKTTRSNLAPDYLEPIDELLARYEFRRVNNKQLDRRDALRDYVQRMKDEGRENELAIPASVLERADTINYRELPMDDLQGVSDALANIEHTARFKKKLLDGKAERDLDEVVGEIVTAFETNVPLRERNRTRTAAERRAAGRRGYLNLVLNASTLLRKIDGFLDNGPAYRHIKVRIDAANRDLTVRQEALAGKLEQLYSRYGALEMRRMTVKKRVEAAGTDLSRWDIISVALNTGNADNLDRLMDTSARGFNRKQLDALLDTLDERDWDFVQDMWNLIDTYWPEIEAREQRLTGVAPKKVAATPVTTKFGEKRGGYYPILYDSELSSQVTDEQTAELMKNILPGKFGKAQTSAGHLIERKNGGGGRALMIGIEGAHSHLGRVLHDLAYSEAITVSWRVLQVPRLREAFQMAGALEDLNSLELWLQDVATGQIAAQDVPSRIFRRLKSNFTLSKLGFNFSTVAVQLTGLSQSLVVVGKKDFVRGLLSYAKEPISTTTAVLGKSALMRTRQTTFNMNIADIVGDTLKGPMEGSYDAVMRRYVSPAAFLMMQKVQFHAVDMPTWVAAYQQSLRKGMDEAEAVANADATVIRAQAGGDWGDRSAFERGTLSRNSRQSDLVRLFSTLGSYMFAKTNVAYERVGKARLVFRDEGFNGRSIVEAFSLAGDLALLFTLEAVIYGAIMGRLPDEEDDEDAEWPAFMLRETGLAVAAGLPFIRDLTGPLQGFSAGGAYGGLTETLAVPMIRGIAALEDGEMNLPLAKAISNGVGLLTGLPSTAVNRVMDGFWRSGEGDDVAIIEYLMGRR